MGGGGGGVVSIQCWEDLCPLATSGRICAYGLDLREAIVCGLRGMFHSARCSKFSQLLVFAVRHNKDKRELIGA